MYVCIYLSIDRSIDLHMYIYKYTQVCLRFADAAGIYQGVLHRHHANAAAAVEAAAGVKRKRGRPPKPRFVIHPTKAAAARENVSVPAAARENVSVAEGGVGRPRKRSQELLAGAGGVDGADGRR